VAAFTSRRSSKLTIASVAAPTFGLRSHRPRGDRDGRRAAHDRIRPKRRRRAPSLTPAMPRSLRRRSPNGLRVRCAVLRCARLGNAPHSTSCESTQDRRDKPVIASSFDSPLKVVSDLVDVKVVGNHDVVKSVEPVAPLVGNLERAVWSTGDQLLVHRGFLGDRRSGRREADAAGGR
jgi:hypothetical protein